MTVANRCGHTNGARGRKPCCAVEAAPEAGSCSARRKLEAAAAVCTLFTSSWQHGSRPALVGPTHCQNRAEAANDWGLAEKQSPMRMRLTAPMRTPAKTKTKRTRHAHAELAAAEPVLRNSPEAPPIMAANPNQTRNESQQARSYRRKQHRMSIKRGSNEA